MKTTLKVMAKYASKIPVLLVVVAAFMLGYAFRGAIATTAPASISEHATHAEPEAAEVWTCSMHPQIRMPQPGSCPLCAMDLVLAETGTSEMPAKKPTKTPKYACSMFCTPPMERPGECPICGMDMVEIEDEHAGDDPATSGPKLTLSASARKLAEIALAPVERRFVSKLLRMVGKVDYDETRLGYLTAWVPGRLERLYVDYTGVPVQKGDHMVELYSPELVTAQVSLLNTIKANKELRNSSITSMRAGANDDVAAARARLRLWGLTQQQIEEIEQRGTPADYMTIYAPMGGIVIHKNAVEGMYVKTGTRIYTIADLSHLWVKLDAYETDLAWIRYGQAVEFETEAYPGDPFFGKIAFIDPVLNAVTRTVKVRVNVPNADGRLKPGMFVRAVVRANIARGGRVMDPDLAGKWICSMHPEIVKDESGECDRCGMPLVTAESLGYVSVDEKDTAAPLVIPASAPLITGKRAVVYVALPDEPGTYEGREIVLGPRAGDFYIVREGLREGEQVVVHGNFKIDSALQLRAKRSMMNPRDGQAAPVHHHGGSQAESGPNS